MKRPKSKASKIGFAPAPAATSVLFVEPGPDGAGANKYCLLGSSAAKKQDKWIELKYDGRALAGGRL